MGVIGEIRIGKDEAFPENHPVGKRGPKKRMVSQFGKIEFLEKGGRYGPPDKQKLGWPIS